MAYAPKEILFGIFEHAEKPSMSFGVVVPIVFWQKERRLCYDKSVREITGFPSNLEWRLDLPLFEWEGIEAIEVREQLLRLGMLEDPVVLPDTPPEYGPRKKFVPFALPEPSRIDRLLEDPLGDD